MGEAVAYPETRATRLMHVLHRQQQRLHPMALGAIGAGIAFCLVIPFITDDSFARAVCIGTGLLMALAYLNFERLTVIVAREVLMVGFPVFKTRIELKDIRRVEVLGKISVFAWGGIGVRMKFGHGLGYIARGSSAIEVEAEGRRRAVTFTCDDPEAVITALRDGGCRAVSEKRGSEDRQ